MKAKFYAFLISKLGWFVKAPIAAGLGYVALQTTKLGVVFPVEMQEQLAALLVAVVVGLGESWLRHQDDKNKVIIQKELGLPPEDQDVEKKRFIIQCRIAQLGMRYAPRFARQ